MPNFRSITYKITGVMFLLSVLIVFFLTSYSTQRLEGLFHSYLAAHQAGALADAEKQFLSSMHQSLVWTGTAIILVSLLASYWLARSITIPLRRLSASVNRLEQGHLEERAEIWSRDEIGQLAAAFNRMSAALAENARLRRRMMIDIAHELKTPVTVVRCNLEAMMDGAVPTDQEQMQIMYQEMSRLTHLIQDLRDLSLAEARQLRLDLVPTDLDPLLSGLLHITRPLADAKGVRILCHSRPLPLALVDVNRIHQVFFNLLSNALRYTDKGGSITLEAGEAEEMPGWLLVRVSDTGSGIAPEDVPNIFDRFYRSDHSRTRKSGGTGVGLAIVKELVEIHGGRISVDSTPGQGTTFSVFLPAAPVAPEAAPTILT